MSRPDATSHPPTRLAWIRPFTTHVFNRLIRPLAPRLPLLGVLTYRGRTSGRTYHTPLNVFRRGDHYIFALTYGGEVQWVKNVLSAGEAELRTRGRDVHLVEPERYRDAARRGHAAGDPAAPRRDAGERVPADADRRPARTLRATSLSVRRGE